MTVELRHTEAGAGAEDRQHCELVRDVAKTAQENGGLAAFHHTSHGHWVTHLMEKGFTMLYVRYTRATPGSTVVTCNASEQHDEQRSADWQGGLS